jgi:hypothetical protein
MHSAYHRAPAVDREWAVHAGSKAPNYPAELAFSASKPP